MDEIHNLRLATRTGAEVSDTLKYFSERIPATFVYAGIDVDREGLFTGTRGRQIAGRFSVRSPPGWVGPKAEMAIESPVTNIRVVVEALVADEHDSVAGTVAL